MSLNRKINRKNLAKNKKSSNISIEQEYIDSIAILEKERKAIMQMREEESIKSLEFMEDEQEQLDVLFDELREIEELDKQLNLNDSDDQVDVLADNLDKSMIVTNTAMLTISRLSFVKNYLSRREYKEGAK